MISCVRYQLVNENGSRTVRRCALLALLCGCDAEGCRVALSFPWIAVSRGKPVSYSLDLGGLSLMTKTSAATVQMVLGNEDLKAWMTVCRIDDWNWN